MASYICTNTKNINISNSFGKLTISWYLHKFIFLAVDLDGEGEEGKEDEGAEAEGEGPQEEEGEQNLPGQVGGLFLYRTF